MQPQNEEFELYYDPEQDLLCSFCGKAAYDIDILIKGPGVYICNECLDICEEIRWYHNQTISFRVHPFMDNWGTDI